MELRINPVRIKRSRPVIFSKSLNKNQNSDNICKTRKHSSWMRTAHFSDPGGLPTSWTETPWTGTRLHTDPPGYRPPGQRPARQIPSGQRSFRRNMGPGGRGRGETSILEKTVLPQHNVHDIRLDLISSNLLHVSLNKNHTLTRTHIIKTRLDKKPVDERRQRVYVQLKTLATIYRSRIVHFISLVYRFQVSSRGPALSRVNLHQPPAILALFQHINYLIFHERYFSSVNYMCLFHFCTDK